MHHNVQLKSTSAFTLIELLVVIAIIAILAAILFPVFAQAKASAKTARALAQIKEIGLAAHMYANDYDDGTIITDSGPGYAPPIWGDLAMPYVKSRDMFWDPVRSVFTNDMFGTYTWSQVTTIAINDSGYSGSFPGNSCLDDAGGYVYGRKLSSMEDISNRVAFVPETWEGTSVGWYYIRAYEANWIDTSAGYQPTSWSWYNTVWDTHTLYPGGQIPFARADGSAGKLRRSDFVSWDEAPGYSDYCAWYDKTGKSRWGAFWNQN